MFLIILGREIEIKFWTWSLCSSSNFMTSVPALTLPQSTFVNTLYLYSFICTGQTDGHWHCRTCIFLIRTFNHSHHSVTFSQSQSLSSSTSNAVCVVLPPRLAVSVWEAILIFQRVVLQMAWKFIIWPLCNNSNTQFVALSEVLVVPHYDLWNACEWDKIKSNAATRILPCTGHWKLRNEKSKYTPTQHLHKLSGRLSFHTHSVLHAVYSECPSLSVLLYLIPVFAWSAFIGLCPCASGGRADNDGTPEW